MDPVSAVGLASSIVGIVDLAARSISALRALQQRWKSADLTISLLISQLTTIKAALSQVEEWIRNSLNAIRHYQLVMDLGASLESCETLLLVIEGQLSRFDWNDSNALSLESKMKAVLQDETVKECATHLANQSTALNLLLTALNCRSLSEQTDLLQVKENRCVLDQVKHDSSSLFCLRDSASFRSSLTATTERSSLLDVAFDFDDELTATKVYHRQWRPLIRGALRRGRKVKEGSMGSQKVLDVRILARSQPPSQLCELPKIMSILCEGSYDPELRRIHIYQAVLNAMDAILDKMAELSLPLENLDAQTHPHAFLCQQTPRRNAEISERLGMALVSLWDDPGVKRCYQDSVEGMVHPSATYFLDSIARISSADYVPSLEDAGMSLIARTRRTESLTLPVMMSSRRYNFIRWTRRGAPVRGPPEASSRTMVEECEELDAVLFTVDLAIYNAHSADGSLADEWNKTLQDFYRICKLPWLAEKGIILLFLNLEKLSTKSPNVHAPGHKNGHGHAKIVDDIIKSFVSLNEDDSRDIQVIFADNDERAKNLECLERAMEQVLRNKAISARNS